MGGQEIGQIQEAPCGPASRMHIGTSGWSYDHWRERFYPAGTPQSERLAYYATRFGTVEVNSTFYNLPSEEVVRRWAAAVPEGFSFAVKGSRYVTHMRRLADVDDEVRSFMRHIRLSGSAPHIVLWQLPPVLEVLAEHGVACVSVDSDLMPQDRTVTAGFAYVRLHGRAALAGEYPAAALLPWASFISELAEQGTDAYVYFNNDANAYATVDAERLIRLIGARMLSQRSGPARFGEDIAE